MTQFGMSTDGDKPAGCCDTMIGVICWIPPVTLQLDGIQIFASDIGLSNLTAQRSEKANNMEVGNY
jgi:hypothetical protein